MVSADLRSLKREVRKPTRRAVVTAVAAGGGDVSQNVQIRRAKLGDAAVLAANNVAMARETEGLRLAPETAVEGVRTVLAEPAHGFYLVAERAGAVVGQALVTYEWSDWRNGRFWWLQSVYVAPEARRQGVFRALYGLILTAARGTSECCGLRLYVHRGNPRAKAAYEALGMRPTAYDLFEIDFVLSH